jgi:pentatricopeptide repeat protein
MNAYAKRKSPEALKRIEEMLKALEEERLHAPALNTTPLDCYKYGYLMDAYIGVLGKESVAAVRQTMERMLNISERLGDDSLRPNLPCYTAMMKAFMLGRQPGFASEVNSVVDQLKLDKFYLEQPARDRMYLESLTMDAWSKSGDPQSLTRARQIFDAMIGPNHVAFNSILNVYARVGNINEVFALYQKMQSDFESGRNKECRPTMHTYNIVLFAVLKSNRSDTVEMAEKIFSAILLPDTVTYTTLINIYAQQGSVEKAMKLLH